MDLRHLPLVAVLSASAILGACAGPSGATRTAASGSVPTTAERTRRVPDDVVFAGEVSIAGLTVTPGASTGTELVVSDPDSGAEIDLWGMGGTAGLYMGADANDPWIGTSTDSALRLVTNGVERARLDRFGQLGIGRWPGVPLDVAGAARVDELCLGADCRSSWPATAAATAGGVVWADPNVPDHSNPWVPGTIAWHIREAAGAGVIVMLPPGQFGLHGSLELDSNVTIRGSGPVTELVQVPPTPGLPEEYPLIHWDRDVGLHDVQLLDFQLRGRPELADSDCTYISAPDSARNRDLRIANLKVLDCSGQGIHVKGTDGLILSDLVLERNGTESLDHNLYLRRVSDVTVTNVRSSLAAGNGFNGNNVVGLTMSNYRATSNGGRGIRFSASSQISISSSQAMGNGEYGFLFVDEEGVACRWVTMTSCQAHDNALDGLRMNTGSGLQVSASTFAGNGGWGASSDASLDSITSSLFDGNVGGAVRGFTVQADNVP